MKKIDFKIYFVMLGLLLFSAMEIRAQFAPTAVSCFNGGALCAGSTNGYAGVRIDYQLRVIGVLFGVPITSSTSIAGASYGPSWRTNPISGNSGISQAF